MDVPLPPVFPERLRILRKQTRGSASELPPCSDPEESRATRFPLLVIQIRVPFEACSTREESLFFASKVPMWIVPAVLIVKS